MKNLSILLIVFFVGVIPVRSQTMIKAKNLAPAYKQKLKTIGASIYKNKQLNSSDSKKWQDLVSELAKKGKYDWNSLVTFVFKDSTLKMQNEKKFFSQKIKYFKKSKDLIKQYLSYLRNAKAQLLKSNARGIKVKIKDAVAFSEYRKNISTLEYSDRYSQSESQCEQARFELGLPDQVPAVSLKALDDIDALIKKWEEELLQVGDDAKLASLDMQLMLHKQSQIIQFLSHISKKLHGTAKKLISKKVD